MTTAVAGRLAERRRARGLSQAALAQAAGVTRQAVGSIESGRTQPGVAIALSLARALDATVEELFGARDEPPAPARRIAAATIGATEVAFPLDREHLAFEPSQTGVPNAFVAGCDLAAGLLSRHASLRGPALRVLWLPMTNRDALAALAAGRVHAAVVHGSAAERATQRDDHERFRLALTEEGWLLAAGNPHGFRRPADLLHKRMRLVNRPAGAAARTVLDQHLRRAEVEPGSVEGYRRVVEGQLDVGRAIAQGFADAGVGMASVAHLYRLDFVPLRAESCSLVVARAAFRTPEVRLLVDTLRSAAYRRDLDALRAYDTAQTGEPLA